MCSNRDNNKRDGLKGTWDFAAYDILITQKDMYPGISEPGVFRSLPVPETACHL